MPTAKKPAPKTRQSAPATKIQGEGDYESARKYNERTRAFVKRMGSGEVQPPLDAVSKSELQAAEKKALARSKGRAGDRADARAMTAKVAAGSRTNQSRGGGHENLAADGVTPGEQLQDTPGRPKSASSRQQTHAGQASQTGSERLDGKNAR